MPSLVVLNGIHAAGKSTIGRLLHDDGYRYAPEIAQQLLKAGQDPWALEAFQQATYDHEAARDRVLIEKDCDAIIESWHVGNTAYSRNWNGSEDIVAEQETYLATVLDRDDVSVSAVYLDIDVDTMWARSDLFEEGNEPVAMFEELGGQPLGAFYQNVARDTFDLYEEHDVPYRFVDATQPVEDVYRQVRRSVDAARR